MSRSLENIAAPAAFAIIVLVAWELTCLLLEIATYLLPSPSRIAASIAQAPGTLAMHASITLMEAVLGFLIGSLLGAILGAAFAEWRLLARSLLPYVVAANTIPVVAIAPILILWFGHGLASKVAVTAFLSFFPLAINAMKGLVSYDRTVMDVFHVAAATPWQRFWKMRFPSALPFIFTGLKLNVTFSVIGAIVAEFIQADRGLGFVIMTAYRSLNMPRLWAAMLASAVIGILFFAIVALVERLVIPWHASFRHEAVA
ncbi:MAG: ABC transporter permease [Geminicoccaceae bacterium]